MEFDLNATCNSIIDTGRQVDPQKWTVQDAISKLFEEGGEFSQAIQTKVGKLDKPYTNNDDFDECADVIMCAIDVLSQANLNLSPEAILAGIDESINRKMIKWDTKLAKTRK